MTYKVFAAFALLMVIGAGCLPASPTPVPDDNNDDQVQVDDMNDLIQVTTPANNGKISNPVTVTGKARGPWYFEASFPVKVYDANNVLLGSGIAEAQSDWMTEDFVTFKAVISFSTPTTATGKLVLAKDNPSGLPENDKSIEIPIKF